MEEYYVPLNNFLQISVLIEFSDVLWFSRILFKFFENCIFSLSNLQAMLSISHKMKENKFSFCIKIKITMHYSTQCKRRSPS